MKTRVIINPVSAGGRTRSCIQSILAEIDHCIGTGYTVTVTAKPGDAWTAARDAASDGTEVILAVGGDGTIHEVVNGIRDPESGRFPSKLGILSSGSGEGFAQSFGLPQSSREQVHIALNGFHRIVDLGRITYATSKGETASRLFINECQVGLGAEVVRRVGPQQKQKGGLLAYALGTLSVALSYPHHEVNASLDGNLLSDHEVIGFSVGNGDRTGGGMHLTPMAILNDGQLDLLVMRSQSALQRLASFPHIYSGDHLHRSGFSYHRAQTIQLESEDRIPVAADGEILGFLPCTIEVIPGALAVQAPCSVEEVRHA